MKRPLAMLMLAALLAGCKSPTAAMDPFFGRQTVAPPTSVLGAASAPPGNNYYQPPANAVGASVPPAPATAANGPGSAFAPPGNSFGYSGSSAAANRVGSRPTTSPASNSATGTGFTPRSSVNNPPMHSTNPGERSPTAPTTGASTSNSATPFQANNTPTTGGFRPATLASRPAEATTSNVGNTYANPAGSTTTSGSGSSNNGFYTPPRLRTQGSTPPTDIMNLPDRGSQPARPLGTGSGAFNSPSSTGSGFSGAGASNYEATGEEPGGFKPPSNVRRASFTQPATGDASGTTRTSRLGSLSGVGSRGDYGKEPNYGWLRGKLEYSKTEDRWKLRYIPIDGQTDDYGGSVTLLGSRELQGFEAGDFVTAYGTLGETSAGGRDYAAAYRLDRVVRQSE